MARPNPHDSIPERLMAVAARFPQGASREALQKAAGLEQVDVQVVRRALQALEKAGRLRVEGNTRARRYFPAAARTEGAARPPAGEEVPASEELPLGSEARKLQAKVRAPLTRRAPVGYQRAFLDAYRPNRTFYLPDPLRAHLLKAGRPMDGSRPAGTYAREVFQRLLIDLSWNSSRLEGNTYSLLDTQRLIQSGQAAEGKDALEAQMILNHKAAIEFLVEGAEDVDFGAHTIRNLHALLSENLLPNPADGGRVRQAPVGIHGTSYLPLEVPQLLEETFLQVLHTAQVIEDPFEQAFFALVHLPYLQPFIDVNKRTARLAANIPFIKANLCPLSFVDVPVDLYTEGLLAVYELNRVELLRDVFAWAYERSAARYQALRQAMGEPDPFKIRYRDALRYIVAEVVWKAGNPKAGEAMIRSYAGEAVPELDRYRFQAVAEAELAALHEGNYARYKIRPSEFRAWRERWGG